MTLELSYSDDLIDATWKSPASGLWVATEAGAYLGMVERINGSYVATDAAGRNRGSFDELGDAQLALDGYSGDSTTSARDVLMTKAIVVMTGITALALALSVLRWL